MRWRVSFSHYSMSVSRSTTNVDVVSMIGTIVFKGAECTSRNVIRLWPGSNCLHVVVKRILLQSRGQVIIFSCHWSVSVISFNEKSEETTINFVLKQNKKKLFCDNFTFIMVLVYYCDEKIRFKWNLILLMLSGFRFSLYHINSQHEL